MDGGRSPVPGQQGRMDIDAPVPGQIQELFGQELAKSSHHDQIRLDFFHFCLEFRGFHPLGLEHRKILGQGIFLHRTHHDLVAPSFGTVRLSHHRGDFTVSGFHQCLQTGSGEFRRSHKYNFHSRPSFGLADRLTALSMNRTPSR